MSLLNESGASAIKKLAASLFGAAKTNRRAFKVNGPLNDQPNELSNPVCASLAAPLAA